MSASSNDILTSLNDIHSQKNNMCVNKVNKYYNEILNNTCPQDKNWNIINNNNINNTQIKLDLSRWITFPSHNSGWRYVYEQIKDLHDPNGILVDDFIERTFSWGLAPLKTIKIKIADLDEIAIPYEKSRKTNDYKMCFKVTLRHKNEKLTIYCDNKSNIINDMTNDKFKKLSMYYKKPSVYKCPWIGFWHNPPESRVYLSKHCEDNQYSHCPDYICKRDVFIESLKTCHMLIVFSQSMKNWVDNKLNAMGFGNTIPVYNMYHPIKFPDQSKQFTMQKFNDNPNKKLLQIGSWLRNSKLIFDIDIDNTFTDKNINYKKTWICRDKQSIIRFANTLPFAHAKYIKKIFNGDIIKSNIPTLLFNNVEHISLDNSLYDKALSENIVVTELVGSSCNNGIIEMIASATPLLVNKLDSVIEYLGENYPFYYSSYDELISKSQNSALIQETHQYLLNLDIRNYITGSYFRKSFLKILNKNKKMDFVITWVNKDDSNWQTAFNNDISKIQTNLLPCDGATINRYSSNFDELKYSLRSIQSACGHFIRNIYIVVHDKQALPNWLNVNKDGIYIIRHTDIMEENSYSSLSIEAHLHKIKDLSETFVYLNDDIWLLGNWNLNDLYINNKIIVYTEHYTKGENIHNNSGSHKYMWSNTHTLLNKLFPKTQMSKRFAIAHSPYVLNKSTINKYDTLPEIESTKKSKFRSKSDIGVVCGFQQYVEIYTGCAITKHIKTTTMNYKHIIKKNGNISSDVRIMILQDDFITPPTNDEMKKVKKILDCMFPIKSRFEK